MQKVKSNSNGKANTSPPRHGTNSRRLRRKLAYALRVIPSCGWQRLTRRLPRGKVHLILSLADHFEPAIVPEDGHARAAYHEQEQRLQRWCDQYPDVVQEWRDHDGRPFIHTYFYPAEQYDRGLVGRLAEHCRAGWGEIEIHLHHGIPSPDTATNLRSTLATFRDVLAFEHGCLSRLDDDTGPRFAFVHGNFALANSAGGFGCGVDEEMQILAEVGCFADLTLPTNPFHPAQSAKINSLYECRPPLIERAAYRSGRDLATGRSPGKFPLMIQGPLMVTLDYSGRRHVRIDNGSFTAPNPPTLERLSLWKRATIRVQGRPDWLFIKLHCHGMDPTQEDSVLGGSFSHFLELMVGGAEERDEILHFVSAREMVNVILAACDGREGNPGDYRDYRFKPWKQSSDYGAVRGASQARGNG
jgi:hypothetical protein